MNKLLIERILPGGGSLQLVQGDITLAQVDAIVNAANSQLQHAGGVARAISKRGGPTIQQESNEWVHTNGPVSHEHSAWASGGSLPVKFVIHAVGPVWGAGDEETKLASAVLGTLHVADELKLASIALPAISTGIYGFPPQHAAMTILAATRDFFQANQNTTVKLVKLVLFDKSSLNAFMNAWDQ